MVNVLILSVWIVFVCVSNCFADETVSLPTYEPGEVFIFSNQRVEQVIDSTDEMVLLQSRLGLTYQKQTNFVVPILEWRLAGREGRRQVIGNPEKLWPLETGKRVRFSVVTQISDGASLIEKGLELWKCKVESTRWISTTDSAFFTYPVICTRYSATTMQALRRVHWYYSPEVGHYVRRVSQDYLTGKKEMFDLVARLTGKEANPARIRHLLNTASVTK